jgi:hypothetical protein
LQDKLNQQEIKAEKIIQYALKRKQGCPLEFLKRNFHLPDCWDLDQLEDQNNLSVFYQIDRYIEDKMRSVTPATITDSEKAAAILSDLYRV